MYIYSIVIMQYYVYIFNSNYAILCILYLIVIMQYYVYIFNSNYAILCIYIQ